MNKEVLKQILIEKNIFKKETVGGKNFQCKCPICGDHKDERKANHLYISTEHNVYHCFLNGCSGRTSTLLRTLGSSSKNIFTKEEITDYKKQGGIVVKNKSIIQKRNKIIFPEIKPEEFINKRKYIKGRINYQTEPENIPGLVFDIYKFLQINNITIDPNIFDTEFIHNNFIGLVLQNRTIMMCRCIHNNIPVKFVKLPLIENHLNLSDYYMVYGGKKNSNLIVMAEGNFSLLAEYYCDSLKIKQNVNMYISTQSFDSAASVLQSLCFDFHIFNFDIIFLSDRDKSVSKYQTFVSKIDHILKSLKIYYNRNKEDFGVFPITPIKGGDLWDVKKYRKNKKTFSRNFN